MSEKQRPTADIDQEPSGYRVRRRAADGRWIAVNLDTGDVQVFLDRDVARQWAERSNRAQPRPGRRGGKTR